MELTLTLEAAGKELGADLLAIQRLVTRGKLKTLELPIGTRISRDVLGRYLENGAPDLRMVPKTFRGLLSPDEHNESDGFLTRVLEILRGLPINEAAREAAERAGETSVSVEVGLRPEILKLMSSKPKSARFAELGYLFLTARAIVVFFGKELSRAKARRGAIGSESAIATITDLYQDPELYHEVIRETARATLADSISQTVDRSPGKPSFAYRFRLRHLAGEATFMQHLEAIL